MTVTEVEPRECHDCGFRGGHASNCDTNNANDPEPKEEPRVFRIPQVNFDELEERFAKLAKRAAKLGVPAPDFVIRREEIEYQFSPDFDIVFPSQLFWANDAQIEAGAAIVRRNGSTPWKATGRTRKVFYIEVYGEAPKFAGWSLLGVVERDPEFPDVDNLVHVISGEADPAWRKLGDYCDHCAEKGHTKGRGRKQLVVVQHENGARKVVGKTCLRDFLGHSSPERIAQWCEWIESLEGECEDADGDDYCGAHAEQRVEAEAYLAFVVKIIHEIGWTPKSAAGEGREATANIAIYELTWRPRGKDNEPPTQPEPKDYDEAREAIVWAASITPDNDYLANLRSVTQKPVWRYKELGIGASVISAFHRFKEQEIKRALRAKVNVDSKYIGEPKQRLEITGTVTFTREFEGYTYDSIKTLVKITTDDGDLVTWWCSGRAPEQGQRVTGKATVKEHEDYKGTKQTVVQRFSWTEVPA